jgi:CheY-like chemotaxis protein
VNKRILIIEDDHNSRYIYSTILKHIGYDTIEAMTGEDGLQAVAAEPPDLILLDIGLPGMNGWEVCARLKSAAATAAIKIIVVTAHAFLEETTLAEKCGAELLLTKPVEPTVVRKHVVQMIGPPAS